MSATLEIVDNQMLLRFRYNEEAVEMARSIPGGKWSKPDKAWVYPLNKRIYEAIKDMFHVEHPGMENAMGIRKISLSKWKPRRPPMKHQAEALEFMLKCFNMEVEESTTAS